MNDRIEQQYA